MALPYLLVYWGQLLGLEGAFSALPCPAAGQQPE